MQGTHDSTRFGKYELFELLGEGGMARVYRAVQEGPMGFRKVVALKQLRPKKKQQERRIRAFINEARLGGHLRHRNVVEVYEFGKEGDVYFIAMEFVRGPCLSDTLDQIDEKGPIPPRVIAQIALQMCAGLDYAHRARDLDGKPLNLVHRDLKPANVMVTRGGTVKIADFGIARATSNIDRTTSGVAKGTPLFMSPEQVMGSQLDARSDLFSLAAVLAQLITGEFVFHGSHLDDIVKRVAKADIGDTLTLVDARMPSMVPVLQRGLQRRPGDRQQNAKEFGQAIRALYRDLPGDEKLRPWLLDRFPTLDQEGDVDSTFSLGGFSSTSLSAPRDVLPLIEAIHDLPTISPDLPPQDPAQDPPRPMPAPSTTPADERGPGWGLVASLAVPLVLLVITLGVVGGGAFLGRDGEVDETLSGSMVAEIEAEIETEIETEDELSGRSDTSAPAVAESERSGDVAVAEKTVVTVTASEPEKQRAAPVAPAVAYLTVNVKNGWAEVYLDQKPIGTTPVNEFVIEPGDHSLWLHNPKSFHEESVDFHVDAGEKHVHSVELVAAY